MYNVQTVIHNSELSCYDYELSKIYLIILFVCYTLILSFQKDVEDSSCWILNLPFPLACKFICWFVSQLIKGPNGPNPGLPLLVRMNCRILWKSSVLYLTNLINTIVARDFLFLTLIAKTLKITYCDITSLYLRR